MEARHARMQECENARKWMGAKSGVLFCVSFLRNNLEIISIFCTFVVSIRNTADTLKSQPDTRAGKPNKQQL